MEDEAEMSGLSEETVSHPSKNLAFALLAYMIFQLVPTDNAPELPIHPAVLFIIVLVLFITFILVLLCVRKLLLVSSSGLCYFHSTCFFLLSFGREKALMQSAGHCVGVLTHLVSVGWH